MILLKRRQQQKEETVVESFSTVVTKDATPESIINWMDKSTESKAYEHGINSFNSEWLPKTGTSVTPPSVLSCGMIYWSDTCSASYSVQPKPQPKRVGEPIYVKINLRLNKSHLPKEENLEFIDFSKIDGYPVFKYWGNYGYLQNLYPVEELVQTNTHKKI